MKLKANSSQQFLQKKKSAKAKICVDYLAILWYNVLVPKGRGPLRVRRLLSNKKGD